MSYFNQSYHDKIMKQILDEYRQNPDVNYDFENMSGFKGGSQYRFKPSKWVRLDPDDEYYQDGTVAQTPYLNEIELRKMNQLKEPYRYFQGSGKSKRKGGKVTKKDVVSGVLDVLPTVAGVAPLALGPEFAPLAPVAGLVANKARKALKKKTGYGKAKRKGGKVTKKDVISGVLDVLPSVAGVAPLALGPEFAPLAPVSGFVANKARKALKKKTGYGKAKTAKKIAKAGISTLLDVVPTAIATEIANQENFGAHSRPLISAISQRQLQLLRDKVKEKTGLGFKKKIKLQYNHPSYYQILDKLSDHPNLWKGGRINQRSINMVKDSLLSILKVGAQGALDFILPEGLEYVGMELGLPPKTGRLIGNFIRQTIRHKTGFGKKEKLKPEPRGIKKYTGGKKMLSDKMKRRNDLVKKIMREKGYKIKHQNISRNIN
jgi:hypothetical protein